MSTPPNHIKKDSKLSVKWLYLAWVGILFDILVIGGIGAAVQGDPKPVVLGWGISDFAIFAIAVYAIGTLLTVVILYHLMKRNQVGWDAVGLKGKLSSRAIGYALVGVAIAFWLYPVVEIAIRAVGMSMYWGNARASHLHLRSALDVILALVGAVFIVPITEEIIFRGYILTMFIEKGYKTLVAILLSALIFTSVHIFFGPGIMVYIFIWTFIAAFLYLKFKSLYPAILFHFFNNLIAYIILPLVGL